jgi:hypothetical protein
MLPDSASTGCDRDALLPWDSVFSALALVGHPLDHFGHEGSAVAGGRSGGPDRAGFWLNKVRGLFWAG